MTEFLQKDADLSGTVAPPQAPPAVDPYADLPPPEEGLPPPPEMDAGFGDVMAAGWTAETIKTDAWGYAEQKRRALADEMFDILPSEAKSRVWQKFADNTTGWTTFEELVMGEASAIAQMTPETARLWAPYPLTKEGFDQRILGTRKAELEAAERVLDQEGGGFAEFIGASARAMTDQTSLALMPFGLQGSALRIIAGEAALGALGEAAVLPRENQVADELGLAKPDALGRILTGAALGGGLSGAVLGLAKGVGLLRARRSGLRAATPDGVDPLDFEMGVDDAEARLRGNETVQQKIGGRMAPPADPGTLPGILNDGPGFSEVIEAGSGYTVVRGPDGQALRREGTRAWRNNNPGNIEYGPFARSMGAIGTDGRFAVFPSYEAGRRAKASLLFTSKGYRSLTIGQAISRYAPSTENDTRAYTRAITGAIGAASDTPLSALTPAQRELMLDAMERVEGFRPGKENGVQAVAPRRGISTPTSMEDAPSFGPTSRGYTGQNQMRVSDDMRIDVDYEVVDASSLLRSSGDLQPRDRSGVNSDIWIAEQAARLDPAQLGRSPNASTGAPLVGPDDVIESGNGRFGLITRAYERHPDRAAAYRAFIEAEGFVIPEGIERPVLVARRRSELSDEARVKLVNDAQDSGVAVLRPVEMAKSNARNLTDARMALFRGDLELDAPENQPFVRDWLGSLSSAVRSAVTDGQNSLNSYGRGMVRDAIFARAWPETGLIEMMIERAPGEMKSLMEALVRAAPDWAQLRADIAAGRVAPEFDITGNVLDAMNLIVAARQIARRDKQTVAAAMADILDSPDLLDGAVSPLTVGLLRKFWRNGRAAPEDEIASFLTRYAKEARHASDAAGGFFEAPTPRDVLVAIDGQTFGDLPEDIGARSDQAPPPATEVQALPDDGFNEGALSAEAIEADQQATTEIMATLDADELMSIVRRGGAADEIAAHPAVKAVLAEAEAIEPTHLRPDFDTPDYWLSREYRAKDQIILGMEAAADYLYRNAHRLAWTDDGLSPPASIVSDRKAVILLGPPAAGKSSIANPYARDLGAMIIDADEAKKIIPEFNGGFGASAVHEESSRLINEVLRRAVVAGDNMVLPKVGGSAASIEKQVKLLRAAGYAVDVVLVDLPPAETWRRMIGRFLDTGRIIPPDVMQKGIDGAPATYDLLKEKGVAHGYAKIDNSPARGEPRGIVEDDAGILPASIRGEIWAAERRGNGSDLGQARGGGARTGVEGTGRADPGLTEAADRLAAEYSDLEITMPDGATYSARDLLADLDTDAVTDAVLQGCAITPNTGD